MKQKMKPFNLFVPITRKEKRPDGLLVEGYTYANAVVGDGIDLTRAAMEAASPDYMRWGAIREMHQAKAAGTATAEDCGVFWDANGALLRALIVDKDAIEKCETGVYKGFSVGVRPLVMRGKKVESCVWTENSLVDRPADPDCAFTIARAEGIEEGGAPGEVEVEVLDEADGKEGDEATGEGDPCVTGAGDITDPSGEPATEPDPTDDSAGDDTDMERVERRDGRTFAAVIAATEPNTLRNLACNLLWDILWNISYEKPEDAETLARQSINEFADYVVPLVAAGQMEERVQSASLARLEGLQTEHGTTLSRLSEVEGDLTRIQGELSETQTRLETANSEVERLKKEPAPVANPVRYPEALARTFAANAAVDDRHNDIEALRSEYARLQGEKPTDSGEQNAVATRMMVIRAALNQMGAPVA